MEKTVVGAGLIVKLWVTDAAALQLVLPDCVA
jgi:hypothetical protein